jgi:hypothetical protein
MTPRPTHCNACGALLGLRLDNALVTDKFTVEFDRSKDLTCKCKKVYRFRVERKKERMEVR